MSLVNPLAGGSSLAPPVKNELDMSDVPVTDVSDLLGVYVIAFY